LDNAISCILVGDLLGITVCHSQYYNNNNIILFLFIYFILVGDFLGITICHSQYIVVWIQTFYFYAVLFEIQSLFRDKLTTMQTSLNNRFSIVDDLYICRIYINKYSSYRRPKPSFADRNNTGFNKYTLI